ncbi:hypothetical protein WKV44_03605 [Spirochaetia bacterium 38H-sp]|uniref:DUF2207 domain-containing protein n=1 Tax=Rarispira pelagica TaxID=3141764 RepID=A0ABU9UAV0_9SPIR
MAKKKSKALFFAISFFLLLSVLLLLFAVAIPSFFSDVSSNVWKSYRVLAYRYDTDEEALLASLEKLGFTNIITKKRQKIEISTFSGKKEYPLDYIEEKFDSDDPRLDAYIKWLPDMFSAKQGDVDYKLMYVNTNLSVPSFFIKIYPVLRKYRDRVILPFFNRISRLAMAFFYFLLSLPLIVRAKGIRIWAFISLGLWTITIWTAGSFVFSFAVVFLVGFVILLDELKPFMETTIMWKKDKRLLLPLLVKGFIPVFILSVMPFVKGMLLPSIILLFAHVLIIALIFVRLRIKRLASSHRIFLPLGIKKTGLKDIFDTKYSSPISILFFASLLGFFVSYIDISGNSIVMPVPVVSEMMWNDDNIKPYELYIAHMAYQDGFLYNFPFKVPKEGESIRLPFYKIQGANVKKEERIMFSYDGDWFDEVLTVSLDNIARLFIENPSCAVQKSRPSAIISTKSPKTVAIILLLLPFCWRSIKSYLTFDFRYVMRAEVEKERRQAAA